MGETEVGSVLSRICRSNRWSYAVFWSFDQRNSMLLTLEDIWYEEQVGLIAANMLHQVHILGEGVIGTAAFTGKHRWIFSDASIGEWNSSIFQDNLEFQQQFSCGIKTVAVIPVHPHGVMQLGSIHKILESLEFLADAKRSLSQVINDDWSLSAMHNNNHTDFTGKSYASIEKQQAFDSSYFSKSSCETSVLTSSEPLPRSDVREQDAQHPSYLDGHILESCIDDMDYGNQSSTFASVSSRTGFPHTDNVQQSVQLLPLTEGELMESVTCLPDFHDKHISEDFTMDLPDISLVEDLFQWFDSSPEIRPNGAATTTLNDNLPQSVGVPTLSSNLVEVNKSTDDLTGVSAQSLITHGSQSSGQDKTVRIQNAKDRLFDSLGLDTGFPVAKSWDNLITEAHGSYSGGCNSMSTCTSKLADGSSDLPRKRLFWELGIEELLDGLNNTSSATKSSVENHQSSASKRSKMERWSLDSNPIQLADPCINMNLTQPLCTVDRFPCKKDAVPKSQVSSWIDDSYSTNIGGSLLELSQKSEEPAKTSKKRARPGESNRPRPKDRQQIQDRIKELRGIIPSGAKCSIDSLLDRTIKYMLFLQSVTKYADKLKETNKPKLIDQENGVALNDKCTMERGSGGVTWAFKVGATPMVCPVIVEDLSSPGQMLVEMLCEERGFFLEIADMIRSYGLTILKGVMEIREDKIWAQFVVEVKLNTNQSITRINVFLSLMELLQQANIGETELPNHQSNNAMDSDVPLMDCFQNPTLQIPITLAEALQ
ncbi:transcription factor bHLH155 isoform X2 [Momordica charantia]|uniref:Transcription factor bHLH155 isoform X2 n=1 Tax=Momordica charantia TaxID=3673 RepID=A0A6J1CW28_MOMCH|nr:transcription factor bHLH155 isoform X2 [Momordica charantia]